MNRAIIPIILLLCSLQVVAGSWYYEPMNFQQATNHSFTINESGTINVTTPPGFILVNGSLNGTNFLSFILESPDNISSNELFIGTISINGSFYSNYYLLSINDSEIVDNKIEIGHGDFNYIDGEGVIGDEDYLLFSLIRVWPVGSDVWGEPAENVRFNCTYPNIYPRTVDSKYTTQYNSNNISALGLLSRMEGISMFRVFVLSQQIGEYEVGENYEVNCDTLYYDFPNTRIIADVKDINLTIVDLEPLDITMTNNTDYVTYTITNNGQYDLKNLEFLWSVGTSTLRQELDFLDFGDSISYNIATNTSGSIDFQATFIPEWMFNSRTPVSYTQETFDVYTTTLGLPSLYYVNHTLDITSILETTPTEFSFEVIQEPDYDGGYLITYNFYDDSNVLVDSQEFEITGLVGDYVIEAYPDIDVTSQGDYTVISYFSMKDDDGEWQAFPTENLGTITILPLTSNAPTPQLLTGAVIQEPEQPQEVIVTNISGISEQIEKNKNWLYLIGAISGVVILILLLAGTTKSRKRKKVREKVIAPQYRTNP